LSRGFVKVMYIINTVEFYPLSFSFYAYIESNLFKLTLLFMNNVCYFNLDIV
jgi:hypothetical protein